MPKSLVIVESPAKAKTISKFLGRNYTVKASVGHVRDLPKSKMGVDIENDFEPQYITIRGKGDVIKELKKEAKKADRVILATDPDREGEAIAWHLKTLLEKENDTFERVAFNAITKDNVKKAIKAPRDINMNLVDAQQARRVLDRLVGYSISPLLWAKVQRGLSAGRVQSVATRLICDREESIQSFVPEEYWSIEALFHVDNQRFTASFYGKDNEKMKLGNKAEVDAVLQALGEDFDVVSSKVTQKKRNPILPFTTSTLQQEASNKLGFSTTKTMSVAQRLYEGVKIGSATVGLITYMRTDSTRIEPEVSKETAKLIAENFGEEYLGKTEFKSKKSSQDAHEAIRPSYPSYTPAEIQSHLDKDQFKLYELIWRRFMASHMAPAVFDNVQIDLNNSSYTFKASGSSMRFDGFLKIYTYSKQTDHQIPLLEENWKIAAKSINSEQHFTQAPPRYTEASLVKEMEELGIGRPSTYAPTISTIIARAYISRDKKNLVPTELGFIVNGIMKEHFAEIVDVDFTAKMEESLDEVENEGDKHHWKTIIGKFYQGFQPSLNLAEKELEKINMDVMTDEICELCGAHLLIKTGRFGKFKACSNYPDCKNTKPILNTIGVKCPICKDGDVIERKTKKFKNFYGCSQFPDCKFSSWHKPTGETCPNCSQPLIEYRTKSKHEIRCMDTKTCKYSKKIEDKDA